MTFILYLRKYIHRVWMRLRAPPMISVATIHKVEQTKKNCSIRFYIAVRLFILQSSRLASSVMDACLNFIYSVHRLQDTLREDAQRESSAFQHMICWGRGQDFSRFSTSMCMYMCMSICMYEFMCVCVYVYGCVYMYTRMCMSVLI
jgi:hypothetical protein